MVEISTKIIDDAQLREERAVVGLVSAAHFFSHFYLLVIPFLFLSIQAEMGLSLPSLVSSRRVMLRDLRAGNS